MLNQIKILPARERVASELRKAIMSGSFAPGEELVQDKLAEKLGVSRMPVREAMQILSTEGLIELRPNKGAVVKEITDKFIRDHFEVKMLLECEAAARAATRYTSLDEILDIHEQNRLAIVHNDIERVSLCNQAFHINIWDTSGNHKMKEVLYQLWNGLSVGTVFNEIDQAILSHEEHGRIIETFRNKDPEKARSEIKLHIDRSMMNIINSPRIRKTEVIK